LPAAYFRTTRSLAQDTAWAAVLTWALAGTLLAAWTAWFLLGRVTLYEVTPHARLEVQQAAHAVSAQVPGRVLSTRLALGQTVAVGEVLAELDAGADTLRLAEEHARLQALGAQLAALRLEIAARQQGLPPEQRAALAALQGAQARIREASAALAYATDQEARLREAVAAGSVAAVEALQARAEMNKLAAAREALAAEAQRLEASGHSRAADQLAQTLNLQRAGAALDGELAASAQAIARLNLDIARHRVRAPVAGTVGDVAPLHAGDMVGAGQKFATVVPAGALFAVADFEPRAVLGRVHAGQRARLRLDGFPWTQFGSLPLTVSRVASEIRDGRIRVEFRPDGAWPTGMPLQHGLPGAIEVTLDRVAPAVLVLRASGQMLANASPAPASTTP
jgi:membrane fusion protein (multidrug efflux system)